MQRTRQYRYQLFLMIFCPLWSQSVSTDASGITANWRSPNFLPQWQQIVDAPEPPPQATQPRQQRLALIYTIAFVLVVAPLVPLTSSITALANSQMNHRYVVGGPRNTSAVAGVTVLSLPPSIRTSAYLAHRNLQQAQPRRDGPDMSWVASATHDSPPKKLESFAWSIITGKAGPPN